MAISVSNTRLEARIVKAYAKMPPAIRPSSKNEFISQLIENGIEALVKDKIIVI